MSTSDVSVDVEIGERQVVVHLTETCEIAHVVALHAALCQQADDPRTLTVDWSRTRRIHTAGLQVLLAAARDRRGRGFGFRVSEPQPDLRAWLASIGADAWLVDWVAPAAPAEDGHE